MPIWLYKINLKPIFDRYKNQDEFTREEIRKISKEVNVIIKESDAFKIYPTELKPICNHFSRCGKLDTFNNNMERLYSWGDYRRCWVSSLL